jgi:hypothetical protein
LCACVHGGHHIIKWLTLQKVETLKMPKLAFVVETLSHTEHMSGLLDIKRAEFLLKKTYFQAIHHHQ